MPFTEDGIRPDLIINPHAIPSRMTIGQITETLFGKVCASYGAFGDCTAFQVKGANYSTYAPLLVKAGFNSTGNQVLYNGMTGDQLAADIYIGPTYYMRLKHMVKDKINYRARGPNTMLTRQPVQGRANDGGLRIGEMERDGVCAHGMSYFLNESFMVRGDEYYVAVCNKTGAISIYNEAKNLFLSPYADGPIEFFTNPDGSQNIKNLSRFGRSFSIIRVPYSLKLLIQELQVMNVQMRIITDENVDQLLNMSYSNNVNKLLKTNDPIDVIFKNVSATMNAELKKNRAIENQYQVPPIEEFGENPEFGVITTSPEEMQQMSPDYAPGSPAYNPESPAYAPGSIPYSPIVQEFGKSPSIENTLSEPQQTILEVEEPKTEEEKIEPESGTEVKKIETSESTESNSSETKKITL
jgi:DNA-directed RNA polymerase II subunit RPB2